VLKLSFVRAAINSDNWGKKQQIYILVLNVLIADFYSWMCTTSHICTQSTLNDYQFQVISRKNVMIQ